LILALVAIALVTGLLAVIAANTGRHLRERQADRLRLAAIAVADSVAAYVRHAPPRSVTSQPDKPVDVNVDPLLPESMSGKARFVLVASKEHSFYQIEAAVTCGTRSVTETREVPVPDVGVPDSIRP
jgi:hypothetical protein